MAQNDSVTVGAKVDPETRKRLKRLAARQDSTMSALIREEIDALLAENDVDPVEA